MYRYNNVLLERIDLHFTPRFEVLPVLINHNSNRVVGKCFNITKDESGIYGTIETIEDISGLYPSLGYVLTDMSSNEKENASIINIGVCVKPNIDPQIPAIMNSVKIK